MVLPQLDTSKLELARLRGDGLVATGTYVDLTLEGKKIVLQITARAPYGISGGGEK